MSKLCPYLWMHQCIGTNASVVPCCYTYNDDLEWKKINFEDGIDTYLHKKSREQLSNGEFPLACKVCEYDEFNNIISHRQRALEIFPNTDYTKTNITFLDIKFTNTCNLSCRMCRPAASSQLEKLYKNIPHEDLPHHIQKIIHIKDNSLPEKKVEYTKQLIKNGLKVLKVTGGEPFACKYFLEVIDWCIEKNYAKQLEIKFTTNATKINKRLLDKIQKFKKIDITVSVDGTGNIYNYIRHQADWDKFNNNIDFLNSYETFKPIRVSFLLQFYNMLNIPEFVEWCKSKNIHPGVDVHIKPYNTELDVKFASRKLKEKLLQDSIKYNLPNVFEYVNSNLEVFDRDKQISLKRTTEIVDKLHKTCYTTYLHRDQISFLSGIE